MLISSNVAVIGNDHDHSDIDHTIFFSRRTAASTVVLEGDNLIGFGTIIIGPVTIGRGTIVGAGSIVNRSIPANSICVGSPARVIGSRYPEGQ